MGRSLPTGRSNRFASFVPFVLGGVAVGLVLLMVVLSMKWNVVTPRAEADPTDSTMMQLPGGEFVMGSDDGPEDERPAHVVVLRPFKIDITEVTNEQFAKFVDATGYKTVAERPAIGPTGSAVFVPVDAPLYGPWNTPHPPWWKFTEGANWRHPEGPDSGIEIKQNHPVVHIAWTDAAAYAKWAGKRLPTEAEWEYAARGGLSRQEYCWGSEPQGTGGKYRANTFQGKFPSVDSGADGYVGTAPVKSFPANGFGLHDMSGNVWEWCGDWYQSGYYRVSGKTNPTGPVTGDLDNGQPQRVRRGGSYLCADGYCRRYLPAARDKNPEDSSASHTGFRCVKD